MGKEETACGVKNARRGAEEKEREGRRGQRKAIIVAIWEKGGVTSLRGRERNNISGAVSGKKKSVGKWFKPIIHLIGRGGMVSTEGPKRRALLEGKGEQKASLARRKREELVLV